MSSRKKKRKKEAPAPSLQLLRKSPGLPDLYLLSSSPFPCSVFSLTSCCCVQLAVHIRCLDQPFRSSLEVLKRHFGFILSIIDTFGKEFQDPQVVVLVLANGNYCVGKLNCSQALFALGICVSDSDRSYPNVTSLNDEVVDPFHFQLGAVDFLMRSQAPGDVSCTRTSLSEYAEGLSRRLQQSQPLNRDCQMRWPANLYQAVGYSSWGSTGSFCVSTELHRQTYAYGPQASGEELIQVCLPRPYMGSILRDQMKHFYSLSCIWYMYVDFNWHLNWILLPLFIRVWTFPAVIFLIEASYTSSADLVSIVLGLFRISASALLWLNYPFAFKNCVCCVLVCGHISYLQANALSKTSSCQGATCFDPLRLGLGQLICDILFLNGADCNNLFVWNFLKELLKYLLWGNVEIPLGSFPRPSLLWLQNDQTWSQNISIIAVNGCNLLIVEVFSCNVQGVIVCWNGQGAKKSHPRLESRIIYAGYLHDVCH